MTKKDNRTIKTTTTTEWGYTYTNTEIKEVDNNSNP